jgi:hypothetical protein
VFICGLTNRLLTLKLSWAFFADVTQLTFVRTRITLFALSTRIGMYAQETTEIAETGLRYKSKIGGSPFQGMGAPGETMSCMKCGQHKPRSRGSIHRVMQALMFFCLACRPKKQP